MPQIDESAIDGAIEDLVTERSRSIRAAGASFGVDRKTLGRRMEGGLSRRDAHSSQQVLTPTQEEMLVQWILQLETQGYAPTPKETREMACQISRFSGGPNSIGKNWIPRFLRRHPELRSKVGRKIDALRIQNTNPATLKKWYDMVGALMERHRFLPANIYNMDETGCCLGTCTNQIVLGTSKTKRTYKKSPEAREWVSIIECISAADIVIPPVVIFKGKNVQTTWFEYNYVPDWRYTSSPKAWTSNDIGLHWLKEVFLPQTIPDPPAPRLLFVDGHDSHASVEFMWECRQNDVYLVYLIPHSSHLCQPLDLSCFSVCKSKYREQVAALAKFNDNDKVKKISFLRLYDNARKEGLTPVTIKSRFRAAGLFPFNPDKAINSSQVLENQQREEIRSTTPPPQLEKTFATPSNRTQLYTQIQQLAATENLSRDVRTVLRKTHKAFEQLHYEKACDSLELDSRKRRIEQLQSKRRKKVAVDQNARFLDIEKIKKAQEELEGRRAEFERRDAQKEAAAVSNAMIQKDMEQFMGVFDLFEPTESVDTAE